MRYFTLLLLTIGLFCFTANDSKACHLNSMMATVSGPIPDVANATGTIEICYELTLGVCNGFDLTDVIFFAGDSASDATCGNGNNTTTFSNATLTSGSAFSCSFTYGTGAVDLGGGTCDCSAWVQGTDATITWTPGTDGGSNLTFGMSTSGGSPYDCNAVCAGTCGGGIICETTGSNTQPDDQCGDIPTGCGPFNVCVEFTYTNGSKGSGTGCLAGFSSEGGACTPNIPIANLPVPVKLLHFSARENDAGRGNILSWATATESNNEMFIIERSYDAESFVALEEVHSLTGGNSTEELSYSYIDYSVRSGIAYYRLKQVDFDGAYEYSEIIQIRNSQDIAAESFEVAPNPVSSILYINKFNETTEQTLIEVIDITGKVVLNQTIDIINGDSYPVDLTTYESGIYHLRISNSEIQEIHKFIKI